MAVEDFMDLTLDAHIVAAAMEFFGMTGVTATPTTNIDIIKIRELPKGEKKRKHCSLLFNYSYIITRCTGRLIN